MLPDGLAHRAIKRWASIYTLGLPPEIRSQRIAEIESDLYEQRRHAEASARSFWPSALSRLLRGMPQDFFWSFDIRLADGGSFSMGVWNTRPRGERAIIVAFMGVALVLIVTTMGGLFIGALAAALGLAIAVVPGRRSTTDERSRKGEAPHMSETSHHRGPLVAFAISTVIFVGTAAYAFSLEHWGDWALVFNVVGPVSLFAALGSLGVLVARLVRDRSGDR